MKRISTVFAFMTALLVAPVNAPALSLVYEFTMTYRGVVDFLGSDQPAPR